MSFQRSPFLFPTSLFILLFLPPGNSLFHCLSLSFYFLLISLFFLSFPPLLCFCPCLSVSLPQLQNFPSLPQFPPISFFLSLPVLFISHHSPDFPSPSSFSAYGLHHHLSMAIDSPSSPNSTWPLPSSCPNSLIRYVAFYFKFLQEASKQVC